MLCILTMGSCTDLDETLYDQVGTQNYYNTKNDVVRATFRPFEHAFWSIQSRHVLNELTADQLITPWNYFVSFCLQMATYHYFPDFCTMCI